MHRLRSSPAVGNLSVLLDSADGSLDAKYEYGAFGEPLRVGGTSIADDNPFRFSTKFLDKDGTRKREDGDAEGVARRAEEAGAPWALMRQSGLIYYGFRYYSPSLGRFLNRDPLGELGGSNLYGFVENDPVNGWDRFGLAGSKKCKDPSYEAENGDEICEEEEYVVEEKFVLPDLLGENPHLVGAPLYDGSTNTTFDGDFQVTGAGGGGGGAGGEDGCKEEKEDKEQRCAELRRALAAAQNSRGSYEGRSGAPGWEKTLKLSNKRTGLDATLFKRIDTGEAMLVYRGTTDIADWQANYDQWAGKVGQQYDRGAQIARDLSQGYRNLSLAGHSLGGGTASLAGAVTGLPTYTFNAAGLHPNSLSKFNVTQSTTSHIQAYYVRGEILSDVQDATEHWPAVGNRIALDPYYSWWELMFFPDNLSEYVQNQVELHTIDRAIRSLEKTIEEECE